MTTAPDEPDRAALWAQAVTVLTQAVRLTRPADDNRIEPDDFADFLASALTAVAGNVGSVERITAGRSGSWEAALVYQLVFGTVGDDPDTLIAYRTEPVRIPLNVALLVEDEGPHAVPPVLSFWDTVEAASPMPAGPGGNELSDDEWAAYAAAHDAVEADLHRRYTQAYTEYADRFRAVVDEEARTIPGLLLDHANGPANAGALRVLVEVIAETDPEAAWVSPLDNPNEWEWDHDPLVWTLWKRARDRLGLPRP